MNAEVSYQKARQGEGKRMWRGMSIRVSGSHWLTTHATEVGDRTVARPSKQAATKSTRQA